MHPPSPRFRCGPLWRAVAAALALVVALGCAPPGPSLDTEEGLRSAGQRRLSQLEGEIVLEGLERPVDVLRDEWGVAHIYAETVHDLFFAQGFVAAQDRLYQMEIWRRTGAGELAEVFGEEFLERDRLARLVRYRGDMEAEWTSYSPDAKAIAAAFTEGVNAYIRRRGDNLPIEFELLGFRPKQWKPEDCLLRVAGLMMVRNVRQEIARAEMTAKLGLAMTRKFFPTDPRIGFAPDPELELDGLDGRVIENYLRVSAVPRLPGADGSNNWVVSPALSATGKPLLAGDPHRALTLPSLRYMVHLVGPGWNVIGAGEPALPGVAIGHNERMGWAFTIVQYDLADLFVERVDPENPLRYRHRGEWLEMQVERERIRVRGRDEPVEVELKFTRHGPVIWEDPERPRVVALRWAGQEPGTAGYLGSLALDRVRNWDEFVEAMRSWKVPAENIVYADVDGNIGWIPAGLLPVRRGWKGLFPVPGFTGEYAWSGFRDVDELPRRFNPPEGFIATANHNIRPPDYRYDLGFDWAPPYRYERIREVLSRGGKFTVADFERLQHDELSLPARRLVRLVETAPVAGDTVFRRARDLLAQWDRVLGKDSAAAALYEVWQPLLADHLVAAEAPGFDPELILENLAMPVLIELLTESPDRDEILRNSLREAWQETVRLLGPDPAAWRWGDLHKAVFRHPLANTGPRRVVFNLAPVERGGDGFTVNATRGPGFRQTHGASYRHVLDLADWDRSVFTTTPGQSGQPGSPHYADLLEPWAEGRYAPLLFTREAVEKHTAHRLVLRPSAEPVGARAEGPQSKR